MPPRPQRRPIPAPQARRSAGADGGTGQAAIEPVDPVSGGEPGLYGGNRNNARCNRLELVGSLEADPAKAAHWAAVHEIEPTEVRTFVETLTPVVLLHDTRVTNHGFRDAVGTSVQSVLQAGTAVLVDAEGMPRVRCSAGNPLERPIAQSAVSYSGNRWSTFGANAPLVVSPGIASNQLVLQDLEGGEPFARPSGSVGDQDFDAPTAAIDAIQQIYVLRQLGDPAVEAVGGMVTAGQPHLANAGGSREWQGTMSVPTGRRIGGA